MTTRPFTKPELKPAAPIWIVRQIVAEDAVEIVFVGHANRAELESQIERIARWYWPLDEKAGYAGVTILADAHADPVGVRIAGLMGSATMQGAEFAREILASLFSKELVAQAFGVDFARSATK